MKKRWAICVTFSLIITFFVPPLFAQAQYSYRFEKFLELIDYYYLQPNNLSLEQMKAKNKRLGMAFIMSHAFLQQRKYYGRMGELLCFEFRKNRDTYKYFRDFDLDFIAQSGETLALDREQWLINDIKREFGEDFRTEGDRMPSFEQWASDGYPPFEIAVRPLPPPKPMEEKPPVQGKKAVRDDEKAIKLLEEEGESTEDLSIDNDYWPEAPASEGKDVEM